MIDFPPPHELIADMDIEQYHDLCLVLNPLMTAGEFSLLYRNFKNAKGLQSARRQHITADPDEIRVLGRRQDYSPRSAPGAAGGSLGVLSDSPIPL